MESLAGWLLSTAATYAFGKGANELIKRVLGTRSNLSFEEKQLKYLLEVLSEVTDTHYPEKDKTAVQKNFIEALTDFKDAYSKEAIHKIFQKSMEQEVPKTVTERFINYFITRSRKDTEFWQELTTRVQFEQNDKLDHITEKLEQNTFVTKGVIDRIKFPVVKLSEQNFRFSGREAELNEIHDYFTKSGMVCVKQVIVGLGGFGKTQLALEYAHRFKDEYAEGILWVDAKKSPKKTLLNFAMKVGAISKNMGAILQLETAAIFEQLNDWLDDHGSFLLIFDNVDFDPKKFCSRDTKELEQFILRIKTGHVLITTQNRSLNLPNIKLFDLAVFTLDDARIFMHKHLDRIIDDGQTLDKLVTRLGRLPLALKQAVMYMINNANCDCNGYLTLLSRHGLKLFDEESAKPHEYDYPAIVTTTWKTAFEQISVPAHQLFKLCAYMAPDKIPLNFFVQQRKLLPVQLCDELCDTLAVNRVVQSLTKYALVTLEGDFLSVHQIVQETVREDLTEKKDTRWLSYCFNVVYDVFKCDCKDQQSKDVFIRNMSLHILTVTCHAGMKFDDKETQKKIVELYDAIEHSSDGDNQYKEFLKNIIVLTKLSRVIHHVSRHT